MQFEVGTTDIGSPVTVEWRDGNDLDHHLACRHRYAQRGSRPQWDRRTSAPQRAARRSLSARRLPRARRPRCGQPEHRCRRYGCQHHGHGDTDEQQQCTCFWSGSGQLLRQRDRHERRHLVQQHLAEFRDARLRGDCEPVLPLVCNRGAQPVGPNSTPTNSATYSSSTSLVVLFTATAPTVAPDAQTVNVSIPAGTLTISTPYTATNPFQLGTAVLSPSDGDYSASAPFGNATTPSNGVTITDTSAGDQPWTAIPGDGDQIHRRLKRRDQWAEPDLHRSHSVLHNGQRFAEPDVVTTDVTNTAVYPPTATGSDGLAGGPHRFATAANGDGSVYIYGLLTLTAPSSTPAGLYTATLTFTITSDLSSVRQGERATGACREPVWSGR